MHPDQKQIRKQELASITQFAKDSLTHLGSPQNTPDTFPYLAWKACADFKIQGWATPTNYGGSNYSVYDSCENLAALGYGCNDNGLLLALGTQMWGVQKAILHFGTEEQKDTYVNRVCSGEAIGAHAINEPGSGSDALNLTTTAQKTEAGYVVTGLKNYIALAPVANFSLVYAATNKEHGRWGISAFLVDSSYSGYTTSPAETMMGLSTAPVGQINLNGCLVPSTALLGKEGMGANIFNFVQMWERSLLLAPQIGTMKRQLDKCIEFSKSHIRNGMPISNHQSVSHKIANMAIRLNTCRSLQRDAAVNLDSGEQDLSHASMVKIQLSEAFEQNSRDAVAIFGGSGYAAAYEHERNLRDAIGSSIYSGTNDIHRELIASLLGL